MKIYSDDAFPQPPFNLSKAQPRFSERNLNNVTMGDLCTSKRFLQAFQVINLAKDYYGSNESVVESPALEYRPLEDLKAKNHRL